MTTEKLHNIRDALESQVSKNSSKLLLEALHDVYIEINHRSRIETKFFNLNGQSNEQTINSK